jgi:hypothetical protein
MTEEWKAIPGFVGYEASSLGRIRSVDRVIDKTIKGTPFKWGRRGQIIRQTKNKHTGYMQCTLSRKKQMVHRLICLAFHGEPSQGQAVVRHKDGSRTNNRFDNLAWASHAENHADKRVHGTERLGSDRWCSKTNEDDVAKMRLMYSGKRGEIRSIARRFGLNEGTVRLILKRETWAHVP